MNIGKRRGAPPTPLCTKKVLEYPCALGMMGVRAYPLCFSLARVKGAHPASAGLISAGLS